LRLAVGISRVGATPLLDIDPETYNISASALKRYLDKDCTGRGKIGHENRQTICALVRFTFSVCAAEMNEMLAAAREHDLLLSKMPPRHRRRYPLDGGSAKAGTMGDVAASVSIREKSGRRRDAG